MSRLEQHRLPAGQVLTVTAPAEAVGSVVQRVPAGNETPVAVTPGSPFSIGPFSRDRRYDVYTTQGRQLVVSFADNEVNLGLVATALQPGEFTDDIELTDGTISVEDGLVTGFEPAE